MSPPEPSPFLERARTRLHTIRRREGVGYVDLAASIHASMARCHRELGDWDPIETCFRHTAEDSNATRPKVSPPYLRAGQPAGSSALYEIAVESAIRRGDLVQALERCELIKSRGVSRPQSRGPLPCDMRRRFDDATDTLLAEGSCEEQKCNAQKVRRSTWELACISRQARETRAYEHSLDIGHIQSQLGDDQLILYYFWVGHARLAWFLIDGRELCGRLVELSECTVGGLAKFASRFPNTRDRHVEPLGPQAAESFVAELWPAGDDARRIFRRCRRLIVSPHRSLHAVPFGACKVPILGSLIDAVSLRYVPNLSCLQRAEPAGGVPMRVVSIAVRDAIPLRSLGPHVILTHAEDEANRIARAYENQGISHESLIEAGPNRRAVLSALGATATKDSASNHPERPLFDVAHLVCHGMNVDHREPFESKLFVQDAAIDGLDIAMMDRCPPLVVLSSCHGGQRSLAPRGLSELPGDEVMGLQAGFFAAGAREIVASSLAIDERVGAELFPNFHESLAAGAPTDLALAHAIRRHKLAFPNKSLRRREEWGTIALYSTCIGTMSR